MKRLLYTSVLFSITLMLACGSATTSRATPPAQRPPAETTTQVRTARLPPEAPASAPTAQAIDAAVMVGSWETNGGDFEEITIDSDGTWSSFLHARPFYSGRWTLVGATLTLASDALGQSIVLTNLMVTDAHLTAVTDGEPVAWTRVSP